MIRIFGRNPIRNGLRPAIGLVRNYAAPNGPQYSKKGNFIVNSLRYVKDVDQYQEQLVKNVLTAEKSAYLMDQIKASRELLYLLAVFHHELAKLGITPESEPGSRHRMLWRYRVQWLLRLNRIHGVFWETCQIQDISEQDHKLALDPANVGILDPYHFSREVYDELQTGSYGGVDFHDVDIIAFSRPFRKYVQ